MQVHLIEGIIDQVESTVHVSWVQPRVLGIPQITSLRDRLDNWVGKVHTALLSVEAETPDLVASWFFRFLEIGSCNRFSVLEWKGKDAIFFENMLLLNGSFQIFCSSMVLTQFSLLWADLFLASLEGLVFLNTFYMLFL